MMRAEARARERKNDPRSRTSPESYQDKRALEREGGDLHQLAFPASPRSAVKPSACLEKSTEVGREREDLVVVVEGIQ